MITNGELEELFNAFWCVVGVVVDSGSILWEPSPWVAVADLECPSDEVCLRLSLCLQSSRHNVERTLTMPTGVLSMALLLGGLRALPSALFHVPLPFNRAFSSVSALVVR